MKIGFLSLKQLIFATVAGVSLATVILPQFSLANPSERYDPQKNDSQFGNQNDPFNGGVEPGNQSSSLLRLIQNAQLGPLNPNFGEESSQQLNDAAADFRKRQQQYLQKGQPTGVQQNNTPSNSQPSLIIRPDSQN